MGKVELNKGNLNLSERLLNKALAMAQQQKIASVMATVNFTLAQCWQRKGSLENAQRFYDIAHQMFQQLGAANDLDKIEREWDNWCC